MKNVMPYCCSANEWTFPTWNFGATKTLSLAWNPWRLFRHDFVPVPWYFLPSFFLVESWHRDSCMKRTVEWVSFYMLDSASSLLPLPTNLYLLVHFGSPGGDLMDMCRLLVWHFKPRLEDGPWLIAVGHDSEGIMTTSDNLTGSIFFD